MRARAGEIVLIPGSMGTASYVGEGLGNADVVRDLPARRRSGDEPARGPQGEDVARGLRRDGRASASRSTPANRATVAEEAAFAYKDIETVMAASATLVRPTKRLTPLGVVKG